MNFFESTNANGTSIGSRVYKNLRKVILRGEISSGTRLVESILATKMKVSRTPVREALHKLDSEGLVHFFPRTGYIISDMSQYDIEDLFMTRTVIEQLTTKLAIEKITAEELKKIEKNLKKTDQVLKKTSKKKMVDLDTEFHEIISKASRSKRLYQISQILRDHMLRFRIACLDIREIAKIARDGHFRIFQAIKSKDIQKLDDAVLSHMAETKKSILGHLKQLSEESF